MTVRFFIIVSVLLSETTKFRQFTARFFKYNYIIIQSVDRRKISCARRASVRFDGGYPVTFGCVWLAGILEDYAAILENPIVIFLRFKTLARSLVFTHG